MNAGESGSPDVNLLRWLLSCAVIALLYAVTGLVGLSLASVGSQVTLLWAPMGIALGALLVGGTRLWPGVFVGSLALNLVHGSPPVEAACIAIGNTLGPVVGVLALRRRGFDARLDTLTDLGRLLIFGVVLAPAITATLGLATLALHDLPTQRWSEAWTTWWLGDATGALLVTPLVLAWFGPDRARTIATLRRSPTAALIATAGTLTAAILGFGGRGPVSLGLMLAPFPIAFAVQVRLGTGLATALVTCTASLAIAADAYGTGPLAGVGAVPHGLTWAYIAVLGGSVLGSAALQAERRQALQRQKDLEAAAIEAQRREAIGVVAAGVAHDFNNLLQAIRGYAELSRLRPGRTDYIDHITTSVDRAAELCRELQHYAGEAITNLEILQIPDVIADIAALVSAALPRGVRVELQLARGGIPIRADRRQIEQVTLNLVANATEAQAGAGGGTVRVVTGTGELSADSLQTADVRSPDAVPGRYAWLEVSDTGPGIDPDIRATIFDPFVTTRFIGRGLGLAAVAGIARGLHGAVFVHSVRGEGTRVRVAWPHHAEDASSDDLQTDQPPFSPLAAAGAGNAAHPDRSPRHPARSPAAASAS